MLMPSRYLFSACFFFFLLIVCSFLECDIEWSEDLVVEAKEIYA